MSDVDTVRVDVAVPATGGPRRVTDCSPWRIVNASSSWPSEPPAPTPGAQSRACEDDQEIGPPSKHRPTRAGSMETGAPPAVRRRAGGEGPRTTVSNGRGSDLRSRSAAACRACPPWPADFAAGTENPHGHQPRGLRSDVSEGRQATYAHGSHGPSKSCSARRPISRRGEPGCGRRTARTSTPSWWIEQMTRYCYRCPSTPWR